jgi:phosphoenolpyruvate-protein kinase (PTS system EI component)
VPSLGAMVELPETVAAMASLAPYADFFSLGTNDLTAATLGLPRTDPRFGPASVRDPAVLRLVGEAVRAARALERPLSLCGDAAGEPDVLGLLVGAGIRSVSVAPTRVAGVLATLAELSAAECARRFRAEVGERVGRRDAPLSLSAGSDHG